MTQTKAELLQTRHQGDIRLGDADSTHYVGFKAPATVGTSLVWTLPAADGTAGYYLKTDGSGNLGWSIDNSGVSLSGSTNNTIATVTGANALQGEANLTFDGNNLSQTIDNSGEGIRITASGNHWSLLKFDSNVSSAGGSLCNIQGHWNGTEVANIIFAAGDDTSNKDDGIIKFNTTPSGGSSTERMRIHSGGQISKGTTVAREQVHFHYDSSDENYLRFTNSTTGTAAGDGFNVGISSSEQAIIWHKESEALLIGTANTERFRVGSAGQLGIGGATYGTSGQVLTSGGGSAAPTWADAAGGGATPTVKTANYTAASGDLVVVNGSGLTITLPSSPSVADSVEIRILGSRYCTVARNGSNIESTASNFYIDTFDGHTKFIYTDSTRGWLVA